jgi:hypothetical protein
MVEAYRPDAASADSGRRSVIEADGTVVIGVIDVPSDEVALFLVVAADAAAALAVVRDRGVRPIRVVPATWDAADRRPGHGRPGASARGSRPGSDPGTT